MGTSKKPWHLPIRLTTKLHVAGVPTEISVSRENADLIAFRILDIKKYHDTILQYTILFRNESPSPDQALRSNLRSEIYKYFEDELEKIGPYHGFLSSYVAEIAFQLCEMQVEDAY